jgi:hypothetical protein
MVVEDEIRAKGLGVVLDGSIGDEDEPDQHPIVWPNLEAQYYRARFEACRDGLWFSIALNVMFFSWIVWAAWHW